jgi:hypothetical protein
MISACENALPDPFGLLSDIFAIGLIAACPTLHKWVEGKIFTACRYFCAE